MDKALPLPAPSSILRRPRAVPDVARRMTIAPSAAPLLRRPAWRMKLASQSPTVLPRRRQTRMPVPVSQRTGVEPPRQASRRLGVAAAVRVSRRMKSGPAASVVPCAPRPDRSPAAQARRFAASRCRAISFRSGRRCAQMLRANGVQPARDCRAVYWNPSPPHILCVTMHNRQQRVKPIPRDRMLAYSVAPAQQNDQDSHLLWIAGECGANMAKGW